MQHPDGLVDVAHALEAWPNKDFHRPLWLPRRKFARTCEIPRSVSARLRLLLGTRFREMTGFGARRPAAEAQAVVVTAQAPLPSLRGCSAGTKLLNHTLENCRQRIVIVMTASLQLTLLPAYKVRQ